MSVRYVNPYEDRKEYIVVVKLTNTIEKLFNYNPRGRGKFLFEGDEISLFIKLMPIYQMLGRKK